MTTLGKLALVERRNHPSSGVRDAANTSRLLSIESRAMASPASPCTDVRVIRTCIIAIAPAAPVNASSNDERMTLDWI